MRLLCPVAEVTRLLSNLIKYQFVNLKAQDAFVIDPEKNEDRFVPLQKDSRVKIRSLEEVERENREKKEKKENTLHAKVEKEDEFSPGVSVVNFDEVLEQKTEEAEQLAEQILLDAKQQAEEIVARAQKEAEEIRNQAKDEGMEAGRQEGLMLAEEENNRVRNELEEEAAKMQQDYQSMIAQIEPRYVDILCSLIQKLTGVILADNKDLLLHLIRSSISDMEPASRYIIRVSPEDAIMVESCRGEISKEVGDAVIEVQEEKGLAKDECIIEADRQMVDCGFRTQLDNLLTTLRMLVQER